MKVAQVIWSNEALNDLEIIYDFLAEKSPQAAQRIVESILSRAGQLESFPESGARLDPIKLNENDYRYLVEGNYKIIYTYRILNRVVYIATVFDTRFDPEKLVI
ncbi:MAG: type II toxin-antitoxin system RelE/ParE family toxin [Cyclobacteriaceae bacterium]|nr:type II toxin-antitoxin system RelE/ParE family toxin [Cyclobacteriaceae bacterium]